ncbi:hypothetical protein [Nocardiopsis salina]|uniref:hypothetical protein n=1 Tax=Nocardiopsis salina TaxID=245836 RepID=UPI0003470229|nr:hypothetical protein [Nocardiopsis salina]
MDDQQLFDELVRRLNTENGSAEYSPEQGGILLHRFQGQEHDPPFVLHVRPDTLRGHLRTFGDLGELFPDVDHDVAALQMFLVHVVETVDIVVAGTGHYSSERRHLVPDQGGVRSKDGPP